jgi:hypothetical protein
MMGWHISFLVVTNLGHFVALSTYVEVMKIRTNEGRQG